MSGRILPAGHVGQWYQVRLYPALPTSEPTWRAVQPFPAGLFVSPDGRLMGTPTAATPGLIDIQVGYVPDNGNLQTDIYSLFINGPVFDQANPNPPNQQAEFSY